ncbi:NUDIX domain-containing protein [Bacillus sp. FJAT-27986]|uniref:NUDIX domain-containing protein n=1 Tax=Bacillus sp. FJAT-27986 TaxID=1743146 RepID=UPI0034A0C561
MPSGGKEVDESFEQCCIREMEEETGYLTEIVEEVKVKRVIYETHNITAEVRYYIVRIMGGERNIRDPDGLIYDIAWKDLEELKTLKLTYPEDRDFLIQYIKRDSSNPIYIGDCKK